MQCLGLRANLEVKFFFADKKHYFHGPRRCKNTARHDDLCRTCQNRNREVDQYDSQFDHGRIDQPIPKWSKLYGGVLYKIGEIKYGKPSSEDLIQLEYMLNQVRSLEQSADFGSWNLSDGKK